MGLSCPEVFPFPNERVLRPATAVDRPDDDFISLVWRMDVRGIFDCVRLQLSKSDRMSCKGSRLPINHNHHHLSRDPSANFPLFFAENCSNAKRTRLQYRGASKDLILCHFSRALSLLIEYNLTIQFEFRLKTLRNDKIISLISNF